MKHPKKTDPNSLRTSCSEENCDACFHNRTLRWKAFSGGFSVNDDVRPELCRRLEAERLGICRDRLHPRALAALRQARNPKTGGPASIDIEWRAWREGWLDYDWDDWGGDTVTLYLNGEYVHTEPVSSIYHFPQDRHDWTPATVMAFLSHWLLDALGCCRPRLDDPERLRAEMVGADGAPQGWGVVSA